MRHKIGITLIISLIFLTFTMNAFSEEMIIEDRILSDREVASAIEILSPIAGNEGDVLTKDENLYINIRLNKSVKTYYSLYKIDPRIFGSDIKVTTTNPGINNLEGTEITSSTLEEVVSEEGPYIPEILSESDKEEFRTRIISDYNKSKIEFDEAKKQVKEYELIITEEFGENPFSGDITAMSKEEIEAENKLIELKDLAKKEEEKFIFIESKYNQLFEKLILEQEEIKISEVLPYYKTEVKNIDSGEYKMVFYSDDEAKKAIKVFYFTLKASEETIEKIVDTIPEDINRIWEIKSTD